MDIPIRLKVKNPLPSCEGRQVVPKKMFKKWEKKCYPRPSTWHPRPRHGTLDPRQKDRLKTESFHSYTTFYSRPSRGEGICKLLKRLSQLSISELMALRFLCICYTVFSSKPSFFIYIKCNGFRSWGVLKLSGTQRFIRKTAKSLAARRKK